MQHHGMGFVLVLLPLVLMPHQLEALPVQDDQHQVVPAPLHLHPSLSLLYLAYPWNDARFIRAPFSSIGKRAAEITAQQKRSWWPKRSWFSTKGNKSLRGIRSAAGPATCLFNNMAFNCDFKNAIGSPRKSYSRMESVGNMNLINGRGFLWSLE